MDMRNPCCHFPFVLIAKDKVAVLHQLMQYGMCVRSILPKILSIVDIAADGKSHLLCYADGFKCGVGGTLRHRAGDARAVEKLYVLEDLSPREHSGGTTIER